MKSRKCKEEGCNNPVWSKGVCKFHTLRSPISGSRKVLTIKRKKNKEGVPLMRDFFLSIWNKRRHKSEISGIYLGREPLSIFFHHILPKDKFEEAKYDENNIILLTLDEHTNCESDMYRYEEVNRRREKLLEKYGMIDRREMDIHLSNS